MIIVTDEKRITEALKNNILKNFVTTEDFINKVVTQLVAEIKDGRINKDGIELIIKIPN